MKSGILLFYTFLMALAPLKSAPAWEKVYRYSELKQIPFEKLARGEVLGTRTGVDGSQLSLGAESFYAVKQPATVVLKKMAAFSISEPGATETLSIKGHYPVQNPALKADFAAFTLDDGSRSARWFLKESARSLSGKSGLNLSRSETALLKEAFNQAGIKGPGEANQEQAGKIAEVWKELFVQRARTFQKSGLLGSLPYDFKDRSFIPANEVLRALRSRPEVLEAFSGILDPVMAGRAADRMNPPSFSWERSDIQGTPTVSLAAFFSQPFEEGYRASEVNYYVSGMYYLSLVVYQLIPVEIEGEAGTFIYRADFVLSPSLLNVKGIERIAAENILLMEIKQSARAFIESCNKP